MSLFRFVITAMLGSALLAPLQAQGIPRNARRSTTVNSNPRLMVANPFAFAPADSAPSVRIGTGVRQELKGVAGGDYQVIEQSQMNDALTQYGYPKDAILSPALATTLAKNIQARFVVTSTLNKDKGGGYVVTARLIGVNDDAGQVVTLAQKPGETPEAFGKRLADALEPAVKALDDAKACIEQRTSKPDKAEDAAKKALKEVPDHGLAEYCLALLAQDKKAPREEVVKHLQASTKGDPLSLPVWTALATQYQQANDPANTLVAFKQMLRVAPTNQKLREELFKYFLQSGHPETALEVADALGDRLWGVRLDTSENLVDFSLVDEMGDFRPTGVNERLVHKVRDALDREGFEDVRIVVSGGFDVEKIRSFEARGVPVDAYGIGSSLIRGANDFTADVVVTDGRPSAKFGRRLRENDRLEAVE
jgi:tetratricopeptide (TPR) repeat protein